jgi:hypothetical protein
VSLARDLRRALDPTELAIDAGWSPDDWQADLLRSDAPRILLNCARQTGKSTTTAHLAVAEALRNPGLILLASPSQRQSGELFRKTLAVLRATPDAPRIEQESATSLEIESGARIVSLPGSEATLRGYSAPVLVVVDEAARVSDDLYTALRPMLAAGGGRLVALSTPWGRQGWFFEAWTNGGPTWARYEVRATDCPRISPDFLAEELRELGPMRYAMEYLCEFLDTGEAVFPSALIEAALTDEVHPL